MSLEDLIIFEPNTLALSSDVNKNFNLLKNEINRVISQIANLSINVANILNNKADINGDPSIVFNVATATDPSHAVNKSLLEAYMGNLSFYIYGLEISKVDNDTIAVSSGQCFDKDKQHQLILNNAIEQDVTNMIASTDYNIYIFGNDTAGNVSIVVSVTNGPTPTVDGKPYYRIIGKLVTDADSHISTVQSFSNTATQTTKTYVRSSRSLGANSKVDLSNVLPADGETYLVWVQNSLDGGTGSTTIETDVFSSVSFNTLDDDANRRSQSRAVVCVPVGEGRWIKTSKASKMLGYMRA